MPVWDHRKGAPRLLAVCARVVRGDLPVAPGQGYLDTPAADVGARTDVLAEVVDWYCRERWQGESPPRWTTATATQIERYFTNSHWLHQHLLLIEAVAEATDRLLAGLASPRSFGAVRAIAVEFEAAVGQNLAKLAAEPRILLDRVKMFVQRRAWSEDQLIDHIVDLILEPQPSGETTHDFHGWPARRGEAIRQADESA